jgi:hypothetical protein
MIDMIKNFELIYQVVQLKDENLINILKETKW